MALDPRLEPGRVIFYPCRFDPLSDKESPHYIVLSGRREVHFLYFVIKTQPSPYQKRNEEALKHFVPIAREPDHRFLDYNSVIWCGQLYPERIYNIAQHVKEKRNSVKGKISNEVRRKILEKMGDDTLKLLTEDQRRDVLNYLG